MSEPLIELGAAIAPRFRDFALRLSFLACVSNEEVLRSNLLASELFHPLSENCAALRSGPASNKLTRMAAVER